METLRGADRRGITAAGHHKYAMPLNDFWHRRQLLAA
jgi:hypothetical protein